MPVAKEKNVSTTGDTSDHRLAALTSWVTAMPDMAGAALAPASEDASFRRYFRVTKEDKTWIAMDAPPPVEDCRPFVKVAGFLRDMALNAPEIIAADLEQGFLLMTDLGSRQYMEVLHDDPTLVDDLYEDAIDALLLMQQRGDRFVCELPPYDEALLRFELALFHDWLCEKHLGVHFSAGDEAQWLDVCELLVRNALAQPVVFVHRDYHSRNLMVLPTHNPGVLDFQDSVGGPLTYDLASLLKDCYIRWPDDDIRRWTLQYYDRLDAGLKQRTTQDEFVRSFDLMGVQRHVKAAGIFARLLHRDGKTRYMPDVPRALRYIVDVAPDYPELRFIATLIIERCLPKLEADG